MITSLDKVSYFLNSLRGRFNFILCEDEVLLFLPHIFQSLFLPTRIFLKDEMKGTFLGYPVLEDIPAFELRKRLRTFIQMEEKVQIAKFFGHKWNTDHYIKAKSSYLSLLKRAMENTMVADFGRGLPNLFWIYHSIDIADCFFESDLRIRRYKVPLRESYFLKFKAYFRFIDSILTMIYDLVHTLATRLELDENKLFPSILTLMKDNVIIFTERYISKELTELIPYLSYLGVEGKEFILKIKTIFQSLSKDIGKNDLIRELLEEQCNNTQNSASIDYGQSRISIFKIGLIRKIAKLATNNILTSREVALWENLLVKLKEYELLLALRNLCTPVKKDEKGSLYAKKMLTSSTWVGFEDEPLSDQTRPIDFFSPWIIDPEVKRVGFIYDLANFSKIVSSVKRMGKRDQYKALNYLARFQSRIREIASEYRLIQEKYLGDGELFSAREAWRALLAAIDTQRYYVKMKKEGIIFNRGIRIALNYSVYNLIPFTTRTTTGIPEIKYEFFGEGIVELSRLITGKAMQEIEEVINLMLNLGFEEKTVHNFFAPLIVNDENPVDKKEEERDFFAYLNKNGTLINEGIVATKDFIKRLSLERRYSKLEKVNLWEHSFIAFVVTFSNRIYSIGVRKLGTAKFKGVEKLEVYEIIDLDHVEEDIIKESLTDSHDLYSQVEKWFLRDSMGIK